MSLLDIIPKTYAAAAAGSAASNTSNPDLMSGDTGVKSLGNITSFIFSHMGGWIAGLIIVFIAAFFANRAGTAAREAIVKSKGEEVQENALVLVERMTRIGIIALGLVIALAINGLNFTAVIGAISLGLGFALKSFIENFISSVIMLAQNRIRIGDLVDINGTMGRIKSIDMRTTVIQLLTGPMVTIPNQTMLASNWTNYTTNPFLRLELNVGVAYDTNLPLAVNLIKGITEKDPDIVPKPEARIFIDEFAESSVNIKVWFWIEVNNPWYETKGNLANRIKKAFDEAGINITCPVRILKLDKDDPVLLKTIDSIKKGYVPEEKHVISKEDIAKLAQETAPMDMLPVDPFLMPKPAPAPVPVQAPPTSMTAKPAPSTPPTHL